MKLKADLMTSEDMRRALKRMSHQILERNQGAENLVLLGIRRRGLKCTTGMSALPWNIRI